MMKQLRENGDIEMNQNGFITLTEKGGEIAQKIYERHELLAKILIAVGVDRDTAYHDACKIEHDISQKSFEALKAHFDAVISQT
jgi:Mn-dependent DtxR family transcriptional regulator